MGNPVYIEESYIGSGKFYADGRRVGNVSAAKLSYKVDTKTQPNFQGGGGNLASLDRISDVNLDMTVTNFSAENMGMALRAKIGDIAAGAVAGEVHTMTINALVDTEFMIDTAVAPVVKTTGGSPEVIEPVDAQGVTNYEVTPAGIVFHSGADVVDATAITVDYTKHPSVVLRALLEGAKEYKLVMDGLNDDNNRPGVLRVWRWKPSPTDGFDLISDDYSSFELKGAVLADTSKPAGKSQFYEYALSKDAV